MTQPSGTGPADLDTIRQILFGADLSRLEGDLAADRKAAEEQSADLERRITQRMDELAQRVTAQLDDLSRRQQAHADRVTQLLDQVMAELTRRVDGLLAETRARVDELKAKAAELDKRKLNATDFGASLAALGQRFAAETPPEVPSPR